jgi:hypothetical protein
MKHSGSFQVLLLNSFRLSLNRNLTIHLYMTAKSGCNVLPVITPDLQVEDLNSLTTALQGRKERMGIV